MDKTRTKHTHIYRDFCLRGTYIGIFIFGGLSKARGATDASVGSL
jgi:hypothetical protein